MDLETAIVLSHIELLTLNKFVVAFLLHLIARQHCFFMHIEWGGGAAVVGWLRALVLDKR